jgi:hypothetical protein
MCSHVLLLSFVSLCDVPNVTVLTFKRTLTRVLLLEFNALCSLVQKISLSSMCDQLQ